jgi:hypothetical protein
MSTPFRALAVLVCALAQGAQAHDAHVHGLATLDVAVDSKQLALHLESPLANLIGFEHPPLTPTEHQLVVDADARLREGARLFVPTLAAGCALTAVSVHAPLAAWAQDAPHQGPAHVDMDADYVFTCAHPARLRDLSVKLFEQFPGFARVDVQRVGPVGQGSARLTPAHTRLRW